MPHRTKKVNDFYLVQSYKLRVDIKGFTSPQGVARIARRLSRPG